MTAHFDNGTDTPPTSASSGRTEKLLAAPAIIWVVALLAVIPGAATSSGVSIATSLIVMGVATVFMFAVLAVESLRGQGVASSESPAAMTSGRLNDSA